MIDGADRHKVYTVGVSGIKWSARFRSYEHWENHSSPFFRKTSDATFGVDQSWYFGNSRLFV
jgi:hypothetical protein